MGKELLSAFVKIHCAEYICKLCITPKHVETGPVWDHTLILLKDIYATFL